MTVHISEALIAMAAALPPTLASYLVMRKTDGAMHKILEFYEILNDRLTEIAETNRLPFSNNDFAKLVNESEHHKSAPSQQE